MTQRYVNNTRTRARISRKSRRSCSFWRVNVNPSRIRTDDDAPGKQFISLVLIGERRRARRTGRPGLREQQKCRGQKRSGLFPKLFRIVNNVSRSSFFYAFVRARFPRLASHFIRCRVASGDIISISRRPPLSLPFAQLKTRRVRATATRKENVTRGGAEMAHTGHTERRELSARNGSPRVIL